MAKDIKVKLHEEIVLDPADYPDANTLELVGPGVDIKVYANTKEHGAITWSFSEPGTYHLRAMHWNGTELDNRDYVVK